jgi:demethylmenaquinone methyltransferase/2-methoxy-6-polyprenyl-1,4-benzoquinol methylase
MPTTATAAPGGPNKFAQSLFSPLPVRYDRLAEVLSFGQNGRWRRAMVDHVVEASPDLVLDVATGPGGVALQLAARTGGRVVGVDLTEAMLRQARHNVARAGARISLSLGRGEQLPFADATFDAVTFTYLLRYVDDPAATISELVRVVKPGGVVANLEFNVPASKFWHFWWVGFTRLVLPLAGWITGGREWFDVGRFLGPNISAHYRRYPVSWTVDAWRRAGMVDIGVRPMSLGGGLVMWGRRAGAGEPGA